MEPPQRRTDLRSPLLSLVTSFATCPAATLLPLFVFFVLALATTAEASAGDHLPEFRECVQKCAEANCYSDPPTRIPLHLRLLLWSCSSECDYTCQKITTESRIAADLPVVQFHGKWPFFRLLGIQEPLSVAFSLLNLWVHARGLRRLRSRVPASYPLRRYYILAAYLGLATWVCSAAFHTRDFPATEQADYFAAAATVLYGLYYAVVRVFRLDGLPPPIPTSVSPGGSGSGSGASYRHHHYCYYYYPRHRRGRGPLRVWTWTCALAYAAHVFYLKAVQWDYRYNMAANLVIGVMQNGLWSYFSWTTYRRVRRPWTVLPGVVVAWVVLAMSMELLDFPPLFGLLDAHSLWHLGTIAPIEIMYNFLVKDSLEDIAGSERLKS